MGRSHSFLHSGKLIVLVVICLLISISAPSAKGMNVTEIAGAINTKYCKGISKSTPLVFRYSGEDYFKIGKGLDISNIKLKIHAETSPESVNRTKLCPLLFTIWQKQAITSIQLPVNLTSDDGLTLETFNMAERTLCFDPRDKGETKDIQILVFTLSETVINFTLSVQATADYILQADKEMHINISSVSTNFYYFEFPNTDEDLTTIRVRSDDNECMLVSIQPPSCPALDMDSNVEFKGFWATVTTRAGISVWKDEFPRGFLLVFVVLTDQSRCTRYNGIILDPEFKKKSTVQPNSGAAMNTPRIKKVHFELQLKKDVETFVGPIFYPLLFFFVFVVVILVVFAHFHRAKHEIVNSGITGENRPMVPTNVKTGDQVSFLEMYKTRLQSPVRISELIKLDLKRLERKSKRFYWSIIIVAVFYFVPVVQLALTYLKVLHRTGERDLCYYNYLCAQRMGNLLDFNHVYSNIGFCILGIIFIIIVRIKHTNLKNNDRVDEAVKAHFFHDDLEMNSMEKDESSSLNSLWDQVFPKIDKSTNTGILYHFGLFYAMGIALVMEGLLSAAYHICPNQINFQYDTSFMYVITVLSIVKLYQFRHPIYVNANITFGCLAVIAVWACFGLQADSNAFKISFTIFHIVCVFNLLIFQYYVGYLRIDDVPVTNLNQVYGYLLRKVTHFLKEGELKTFRSQTLRRGMPLPSGARPNRTILPSLAIIVNILVILYNALTESNFASQLLAILILNLVMYFSYYAIMKFIHNEYKQRMWMQSLIYSIMSLCFWVPSLYYFQKASTSWESSPAESREKNEDCLFMVFDGHDLWHFLSSCALFCLFMTLLTIDDDLVGTSKDEIPVF